MGMTTTQLQLIRAIAEKKYEDAKKYAIACCIEDNTKKNEYSIKKYKNMLENNPTILELPYNIKGMAQMEDVSNSFRIDRYFLSKREKSLFNKISNMNEASLKLMEMGIPYLNAILLTGISGTGKTTFGRYVANQLNLPFLYINFSYLIESLMGKTSQNLRNVFDYAKSNKCLLMLDEIDCIAQIRKGSNEGTTREYNNTTIALLQELDQIKNDSIIIGATNIPNAIDPAVMRRFVIQHEILPLTKEETSEMIIQYMETIDYDYDGLEDAVKCLYLSKSQVPQSDIINYIIDKITTAVVNKENCIHL